MTDEEEINCEYCGGEVWDDSDLQNGKCIMCVVNYCHHRNFDEVDSTRDYVWDKLIINFVCMDCEVCWTVTHRLDNGIKSKLTHEEINTDDLDQD